MGRNVFLYIVEALSNIDPYFRQRINATGKKGLSLLQKSMATIRTLAYGISANIADDCVQIGKSMAIEYIEKFVEDVILVFETKYLQKPNSNYVQRLLQMAKDRSFPRMMNSIDCMH